MNMRMKVPKAASPEQLEQIGKIAANMVRQGDRVGLGSGRAALAFVRMLGERVKKDKLKVVGVPTSIQTTDVAREVGLTLGTLAEVEALELTVDGADEVDPLLNLIKGGGGYLTREKVVASVSKRLVIIVGQEKIVEHLGTHFPVFVEVIEFARPTVTRKLQAMGAVVEQRTNEDGSSFLTDNKNSYLHCRFGPPPHYLYDPGALDLAVRAIPGVVETGLFIDMADEVIVARLDGTVERKRTS
jgi:ribose 5-phosphate isomerase A